MIVEKFYGKEIYLAKNAGFCMGVKRAVNMVLNATLNNLDKVLYTYGPLVHNNQVTELLDSLGVSDYKRGKNREDVQNKQIFIRAHGVPPEEELFLKSKGFCIKDATCPHVKVTHKIIQEYSQKGYFCIVFGDPDHAEVKGILGYAPKNSIATTNANDVYALNLKNSTKVCVLSQTTQNEVEFMKFVNEIKLKFDNVIVKNTICNATEKRQDEMKRIAKMVDFVIVIGGKHSGNTKRLYEIGKSINPKTIWIEKPDELGSFKKDILNSNKIGISAGASTPQWIIDAVKEEIKNIIAKEKNKFLYIMKSLFDFIIRNSLLVSFACFSLTYFFSSYFNSPHKFLSSFIAAVFIFVMFFGHKLKEIEYKDPTNFKFYREKEILFQIFLKILLLLAIFISFYIAKFLGILYLLLSILGLFYVSKSKTYVSNKIRAFLLKIPGSKDLSISFTWGFFSALVPYCLSTHKNIIEAILVFLFITTSAFIRTVILDYYDLKNDRIMGKDSFAFFYKNSDFKRFLLYSIVWEIILFVLLIPLLKLWSAFLIVLPFSFILIYFCEFVQKECKLSPFVVEFIMDFCISLPFIIYLVL